jgi:hypothetical protein
MPRQNIPGKRSAEYSTKRKRKNASTPGVCATRHETSENPEGLLPTSSESRPRRRLKKQITVGKALREKGLDEYAIADNWARVLGKLNANNSDAGVVQKLLVDVLKECSRQLETAHQFERACAAIAPVTVRLVHAVARPVRLPLPAADPVDI